MSVMLRSAYIHWSPDLCQLEYRCVFCALVFNTHIECLAHVVEPCGKSPQQGVPKTDRFYDGDFVAELATNGCLPCIEPIELMREIELLLDDDEEKLVKDERTAGDEPILEIVSPVDHIDVDPASSPAQTFSQTLLRKLRTKSPEKNAFIECDICDEHFQFRSDILEHMKQRHQPHKKEDANSSYLDRHSAQNDSKRRRPRHTTSDASSFGSPTPAVPLNAKPKPYCCEICGKQMSEKGNLMVHKRIHTGERPFPCQFDGCERRFLSSSERKIHMRTHSGEKPFKCDQCARQFHNKNHLNTHMRTLHSDERPFRCDECGRTFKIRMALKNHQLTHTGERPHRCNVCGNSFRQRSAFQVHMNIHTDNRPFKCGQCDRGFHSSAARWSHEKIFHRVT